MEKELLEIMVDSGAKAKLYVVVGIVAGVVGFVGTRSYIRRKSEQERLTALAKGDARFVGVYDGILN